MEPIHITDKSQIPTNLETYSGEIFLRISDYIQNHNIGPQYFVSNYGRIYDAKKGIFKIFYCPLKFSSYDRVLLYGKEYSVHRIAMSCFVENNFDNYSLQVDHINGIKNDNRINLFNKEKNNLDWVTPSENRKRAFQTGLSTQFGESNSCCKITIDIVYKIANLLMQNKGDIEIAEILKDYNVTPAIVANIRNKRTWQSYTTNYNFPKMKQQKIFSDDEVHMICKYFQDTKEKHECMMKLLICEEALRYFGYPVDDSHMNAIKLILRRVMYKSIVSQYNY